VAVEKLRLIYVRARLGGAGSTQSIAHMVLGYYETPAAEPLVLDSLLDNIMPASQRKDLTPVFSFNARVYMSRVHSLLRWTGSRAGAIAGAHEAGRFFAMNAMFDGAGSGALLNGRHR
jgi:hypothetical protein